MLIDKNGREFDPKKLPKNRKAREAVLATLREVRDVKPKHGGMFNLQTRGVLR